MCVNANPQRGKTEIWRAGCGRTASPVRREGAANQCGLPTPILAPGKQCEPLGEYRATRGTQSKGIGGERLCCHLESHSSNRNIRYSNHFSKSSLLTRCLAMYSRKALRRTNRVNHYCIGPPGLVVQTQRLPGPCDARQRMWRAPALFPATRFS